MKWRVSADLVGGFYVGQVEAETEDEARALGEQLVDAKGAPTLCHACASEVEELEVGEKIFLTEAGE